MGVLPIFLLLASPFVGSFLGLLAIRLPAQEDVVYSRSKCRSCGARLAPRDLVPLLSFALNKGRCRACNAPIPIIYPLIEIGAVFIALTAMVFTTDWLLVATCLLGWALLALAASDLSAMILPNAITLPLIPLGIGVSYFLPGQPILDHLIGGAAGAVSLWLIAVLYERFRGRAGLGMGDVKLFAGAGAWLGWMALPFVMLVASVIAILGVLILSLLGRKIDRKTMVPFGAALAAAFYIAWLWQRAGYV